MPDTADSIASLCRVIADDDAVAPQFLDTAYALPLINAGWREVQRRLALAGSPILRQTVILVVPANTTQINSTGAITNGAATDTPVLPADFIMPYRLEEQPVSTPTNDFAPMDEKRWPRGVQPKQLLGVWSWEGGVITFIGATQDLNVRMEYARFLPSFETPDDAAPTWAIDAIAWGTLFMVALARGASDAHRDRCSVMADQQLAQLQSLHVKRDQQMRRHRPAHRRWRF